MKRHISSHCTVRTVHLGFALPFAFSFAKPAMALLMLFVLLFTLGGSLPCRAQKVDPKGDEYFFSRCYEKATEQYLKVFAKNPSNKANPKLLKRITESVLASEMLRDTAAYFIELYLDMVHGEADAHLMAARANFHAHRFDRAIMHVDSFRILATTEEELQQADVLNSWIRNARRMLKDTLKNAIINLGDQVNSRSNEINPYIINDGQTLVFSCDDKFDRDAVINVFNIKASDHDQLSWTPARKVSGEGVNTLNDEHPSGVTPNGIFFCSNREHDFKLYTADYAGNGRFKDVYEFKDPIDLLGSEVAGCFSPSGDTLYFSGTAQNGKLDIYYSIFANGQWREARPIPGLVNRFDSDENFPYLVNGGTRLYFASDREGTMGGYDIFYSDFDFSRFEWGPAVQMPYPINDTYDNMTISYSPDGRYAYLSMFRADSYGARDVYALLNDRVLPTSAIVRYTLKLYNAQRKQVDIDEQPSIEVRDQNNELVAIERVNLRTKSFIVVLDPGTYTLTVEYPEVPRYEEKLVVEDRLYNATPIEKTISLKPTTAAASSKK